MSTTLLVIPHYNDADRLEPFLKKLMDVLPSRFTIVVSDDGSSPAQRKLLCSVVEECRSGRKSNAPQLPMPLFTQCNTGKGGAVARGWADFKGHDLVAFADADGAVSAGEILRAEEFLRSTACLADALFASRVKMLGRTVERNLRRHLTGRVFATLVSELSRIPVYDSQCGLKVLRVSALQTILPHLTVQDFAFDVELLLLLLKAGFVVEEFPVDWIDVPGSKVSLFKDSWKMALQVLRINRRLKKFNAGKDPLI